MLSHQRWPYVGRFARGWHRLPGRIPGQPQTRTRALLRIGSPRLAAQWRPPPCDRPGRGHGVDLRRARLAEHIGGRRHRRPRGEHVVDEQYARRTGTARPEYAMHRHPAFCGRAPRLRRRRHRTTELPSGRALNAPPEGDGQRSRLVEPTLRAAGASERNPSDDIDVGDQPRVRDRGGERRRDVAPPGELQSEHRFARRTVVHERRSRRCERRWWAVLACGPR
jgi:hypothetical protein